ncbi:MAG: DUF2889 domain-containing protein [Bacillota bacterium]
MVSFHRNISIKIDGIEDDKLGISAHMKDSYHDILLTYEVTLPSFIISNLQLVMEQIPEELCRKACDLAKAFEGIAIAKGFNQKVIDTAGGPNGCVNLLNMLLLSAPLAINNSWSYFAEKTPMSPEDQDNMRYQAMKGKCLAHPVLNNQ